jgi:16S rRNA (cytosine967-C5)-methyltransferase
MSRWTSYLQKATELVETYRGDTPLAPVLKEYFRARKQMGSTDRRWVSELVYGYYRLGHAGRELPVGERLLLGYLLTHKEGSVLLEELKPSWAGLLGLQASAKLAALSQLDAVAPLSLADIFPWQNDLSQGIDPTALTLSHLQQPAFFIRLRPGRAGEVRDALRQKGVAFEETDNPDALRVPAGAALQEVLPADTAYVVQDLSSQRVGDLFGEALGARLPGSPSYRPSPRVWDCCAASGGKSILLKDLFPDTRLTVSDLRPSILHNLEKRFAAARISYDRAFAADLTKPLPDTLPTTGFDLVLADVPCSGSGTWSRTPEQLYFFTTDKIAEYARLQRAILSRVAPAVRSGGYLLLVTCSVFAEENEYNVAFLTGLGFETLTQRVFTGYDRGADTLFGALLQKP